VQATIIAVDSPYFRFRISAICLRLSTVSCRAQTSALPVQRLIVQKALLTNNSIAPLGIKVARRGL